MQADSKDHSHVSMVAHTGKLVDSVEGVLDAATAQCTSTTLDLLLRLTC